VSPLSDAAVRHIRQLVDRPDPGPRYEVLEPLGRGGMGTVYRVFDRVLDREVALKVLSLPAQSDALAARLEREARVLARLEHPGIVAVHDAGVTTDGRPFYVMRLVRGSSLEDRARREGVGGRLRLFLQMCDAVAFAHARGVIHRDLKPGNIMVGEFGEVLVLDWGVAKVAGVAESLATSTTTHPARDATLDGAVVGTPGFMPPEQAVGRTREADPRADVYALGAILRELQRDQDTAVARPLAAIVARATAQDPAGRYPAVEALAEDVRRWLDAEPVSAYQENLLERAARFSRRNRVLLLLLAGYAVVRVGILLWRGV
jgi:serine/threonine protein kinase